MKIAFFVEGYLPLDAYGVPRYVERLANYLADEEHQIFIIVIGRKNLSKVEKPRKNLTIYRITYIDIPLKRGRNLWSLILYTIGCVLEASRLVKNENIQILHGHMVQRGGLQSALISKLTGKPCIITLHGQGIDGHTERKNPIPRYLRWAKLVICREISAMRKILSWGFTKEKVILFPQGCVDIQRFKPAKNKLFKKPFVITFLGRLIPFKNPHLLLEAAPFILSKYADTLFQFVGDGYLKESLIVKAESMNIDNNVKLLGYRSDVDKLLRNSDIFVSLSPYQNVGSLSLLEAMATGVPVVATDVGETRLTVRDRETGLLVKCDPRDVAEKILMIFDNEELARAISKNERQFVVKEHSVEALGKIQEEIYLSIIHNRKVQTN